MIRKIHGIIITIRKHIVTQEALAGASKAVSIDESPNAGIVVTALEAVEPGFRVVAAAAPFVEAIISHFRSLRKAENKANFTK